MRILKITMENFRSLSEKHNYITLTDNVIAIVGKNGSGKSNILDALDGLQFFQQAKKVTLDNRNRFIEHSSVEIAIDVEIASEDYSPLSTYSLPLPVAGEKVRFTFFKNSDSGYFMSFAALNNAQTAGDTYFTHILKQDKKMSECFSKLLCAAQKENTQNWQKKDLDFRSNTIYWAEHYSNAFTINLNFDWLKRYSRDIPETDLKYLIDKYSSIMNSFARIMPKIFIYRDKNLLDCYRREDLEKDKTPLTSPSGLSQLIGALGETPDSFLQALGNQQTPECQSIQRRFHKSLSKFNDCFNKKYNNSEEQVELTLHFDHEQCVINVATHDNDTTFRFSERSNGLKWYIGFFAALQNAGIHGKALILIDEPAVHLHVDAQKEVLQLFDNLAKDGHQLIYTTHSPSMLDINRWERIRTVEKEKDISQIYMLHESHPDEKRLETLSPVQQAMGCCLKNTLAPDSTRRNLITEGITDDYYCKAMFKCCNISEENQPFIIPACSADNIPNILAILLGWGYNFRVLLDNDTKGKSVFAQLKKGLGESVEKNISFVSDNSGDMIEDLLSVKDRNLFKKVNNKGDFLKTISAMDFMNAVLNDGYTPDNGSIDNFRALFVRMGLIPLKICDSPKAT